MPAVRLPMMVIAVDGETYHGLVVIDSITNDTSSGGVRIAETVPADEVQALAREMTLKFSFFQLPRGGAKAGISMRADLDRDERSQALRDFGAKLGPVIRTGLYYPGMDLNCSDADLREIYAGAGIALGHVTDSSFFTALSARETIYAYQDVHGSPGAAVRLAIDGLGRVATHLLTMLPENQFKVVAFSTLLGGRATDEGFDKEELLRERKAHGDHLVETLTAGRRVRTEDVLEAEVDLLLPSSRAWVIHAENVDRIAARGVIPIANAPYTEPTIDTLHRRGVVCLPGFVTNAGGVFGSSLRDQGVSLEEIDRFAIDSYRPLVRRLLEESRRQNTSPVQLARAIAEREARSRRQIRRPDGMSRKILRRVQKRVQPRRMASAGALRALQVHVHKIMGGLGEVGNP